MGDSKKFDELRPILKLCNIYEGGKSVVVEHQVNKSQVVLPKENHVILNFFDGHHSIKDISSALYGLEGQVSFHSIITTIKLLHEAELLDGVDDQFEGLAEEKSPHEQKASLLNRPIFEFKILNQIKVNFSHEWSFLGLVLIFCSLLPINYEIFTTINLEGFLRTPHGYDEAIFRIFCISSVLMTLKSLMQASLLVLSTGSFYGPYLRLYPYALAFGINDNSLYSHPKKDVIVTYSVMSAFLYLVASSFLSLIPGVEGYRNDIVIMSLLLTFIELNPYRRSDLTKLFYFFYAENQLKNIMPYLKNCSLAGIWKDTGAKISDELRYVTYSFLSILWAIGFTLFSFEIVLKSFPSLFYEIQLGSSLSKSSAILVCAGLFFITGYLLVDLFHTVFKNILSPLLVPLVKFQSRSKEYKKNDLEEENVRIHFKKHMLFNQFSDEAIDFLLANAVTKIMKKGDSLIIQGDEGKNVFFLVRGTVNVSVKEKTGRMKHIVSLGAHTVIGEMAILNKTRRSANVIAAEEIVYLEFNEEVFTALMNSEDFQNDYQKLKNRIEISQFVSSANMFKDFPPEIMNLFVEVGDLVIFPQGCNVVDEGERDKTFYLLIRGKVEILKGQSKVAELNQGDFFGEVALIANVPRTASVRTLDECLFLYIEDKKFWKILSENIELAMYIESVGRHRMVEAQAA